MQPPKPPLFVRDRRELDDVLSRAKLLECPRCGRAGTLIGHGYVRGYAEHTNDRVIRGRRLLCSRRHRRSGCGHTRSVYVASIIRDFVVGSHTLSRMWQGIVDGCCPKIAWERSRPDLCLRSAYRLWKRLLAAQSHIRTATATFCAPPASDDVRPFAQLFEHLNLLTEPAVDCVIARFQLATQKHLFD
jgi:hypothetical protein